MSQVIGIAERRRRRSRKIKSRMNLLKSKTPEYSRDQNMPKFAGMLANNNEVNAHMGRGRKRKTKTKHMCASYRHHGGYGPAKQYTARDKRRVEAMNEGVAEYFTEKVE